MCQSVSSFRHFIRVGKRPPRCLAARPLELLCFQALFMSALVIVAYLVETLHKPVASVS